MTQRACAACATPVPRGWFCWETGGDSRTPCVHRACTGGRTLWSRCQGWRPPANVRSAGRSDHLRDEAIIGHSFNTTFGRLHCLPATVTGRVMKARFFSAIVAFVFCLAFNLGTFFLLPRDGTISPITVEGIVTFSVTLSWPALVLGFIFAKRLKGRNGYSWFVAAFALCLTTVFAIIFGGLAWHPLFGVMVSLAYLEKLCEHPSLVFWWCALFIALQVIWVRFDSRQ